MKDFACVLPVLIFLAVFYLLSDRGAVPDQFYGLEHVK